MRKTSVISTIPRQQKNFPMVVYHKTPESAAAETTGAAIASERRERQSWPLHKATNSTNTPVCDVD